MKIIHTDTLNPDDIPKHEREWIYNGLDCCVTREILDVLLPQLDNRTTATYAFERALQGPILEMRLRGVLVDPVRKIEVIDEYFWLIQTLEEQLQNIVGRAFGMWDFNWRPNSRDLPELFYKRLRIPAIRKHGRPTCDRDALEKLENYFIASILVKYILRLRDLLKKISVLRTEIDDDGRIRTSYNIAGTTTGRLSSSFSEFGTGGNLQNIEESLRSIFIADPGYKLAYLDAEQGESRCVGATEWNLFRDPRYLDACEGGDLHTAVAKLCWPELPWPGDLVGDRKLAEQPYYRHYDRRFMCKKIGHGTNYGGQPKTISEESKVDIRIIEDFQPKYFRAFPAHLLWHQHVYEELREFGYLTTLTGRRRHFLGRRNDDAVRREAIAYDPQGSLADIVNSGMLNVWRRRSCQVLMQIHDAILIQYPQQRENEVIEQVRQQLEHPIILDQGRHFVIPYGVATGWNWGKHSEENPDGIKTFKGSDQRKRSKKKSFLDTKLRGSHRRS
jgi:DNA polymerase I